MMEKLGNPGPPPPPPPPLQQQKFTQNSKKSDPAKVQAPEPSNKNESNKAKTPSKDKLNGKNAAVASPKVKQDGKNATIAPPKDKQDGKNVGIAPPKDNQEGKNAAIAPPKDKQVGKNATLAPPKDKQEGKNAAIAPPKDKQDGKNVGIAPPKDKQEGKNAATAPPKDKQVGKNATVAPPKDKQDGKNATAARPKDKQDGKNVAIAPPEGKQDAGKNAIVDTPKDKQNPQSSTVKSSAPENVGKSEPKAGHPPPAPLDSASTATVGIPSTEPDRNLPKQDGNLSSSTLLPTSNTNSSFAGVNKKSPQSMFIPSTQDHDVYEFKTKDIMYENSRIMLLVHNGGKLSQQTDFRNPDKIAFERSLVSSYSDNVNKPSNPSMTHLKELYKEQKLCDLSIKIPEGPSFKMHKFALTARSKKYLDLFKQQDKSQPDEIVLQNVSPNTVQNVIEYLYDQDINITEDNLEDVLNCALQLDTKDLVEKCLKYLENVNEENVLHHLQLSVKYVDVVPNSTRNKMINICVEKFTQLIRTEMFRKLTVEVLTLLLQTEKIHSLGEAVLFQSVAIWLNHDLPKRKDYVVPLLKSIRLNDVSPKLINELIDENKEISQLPEIKQMVFEAFRYHALHPRQN